MSSNRITHHNHHKKEKVYSKLYNKKILTVYGEPYFGLEEDDRCRTLSVSIPWSLDDYITKHVDRLGISKSRYIRMLIEEDLNLEHIY